MYAHGYAHINMYIGKAEITSVKTTLSVHAQDDVRSEQGDQNGQIFAYRASVYFGQFFNIKVAQNFFLFYFTVIVRYVFILTQNQLGYILGDFLKTHLVTLGLSYLMQVCTYLLGVYVGVQMLRTQSLTTFNAVGARSETQDVIRVCFSKNSFAFQKIKKMEGSSE
jgi:hypothetical protein